MLDVNKFKKNTSPVTGIVVVSYNAAEAVRLTLASVRRALNSSKFKLILVDNASEFSEREKIRSAMLHHISEVGDSWSYIEESRNLGFSGGNNVGIQAFLNDNEITHICLLNSDVIVSDNWLDNLLESGHDIVSPVTNKAASEQCIPIDYELDFDACLKPSSEIINEDVYLKVNDFYRRWRDAWKGNLVEAEPTFFCILISKKAFNDIGLLDDTFFPGGFEDDDYCLRAKKAGYKLYLTRDVYMHHWGSASFGKLQYDYFNERAERNKRYLETKHNIKWKRRPEKPIVSFALELNYLIKNIEKLILQKPFIEIYLNNTDKQIKYFESEFNHFNHLIRHSARIIPDDLSKKLDVAEEYGDLLKLWATVETKVRSMLSTNKIKDVDSLELEKNIEHIIKAVHDRVNCNFAIHEFVNSVAGDHASDSSISRVPADSAAIAINDNPKTKLGKLLWNFKRAVKFIKEFDGIVFFGGYFYPERQSDGYFQRIQIVDRLFSDRWRIYVESEELKGRFIWFDRPQDKVLVLRVTGSKKRKIFVRFIATLAALRSRKIYFHSVLRMYDNNFGKLMHIPFIKKVIDIHGVVPEEFRMHNDFYCGVLFDKEESLAVRKAGLVIVVTKAMTAYLQQKYRNEFKGKPVEFPMFPNFSPEIGPRSLESNKPVVVYAGGLHKWQQVSKMIHAISSTIDRCSHRFYCSQPDIVKDMLPVSIKEKVVVESKTHDELMVLYPQCHYGFILREDIIVNRVACPTKLIEYFAMGIVPIIDSENIGDFKALGMQSVSLDEFLAGNLPLEEKRLEMAAANYAIYENLKNIRQNGAVEIQDFFGEVKKKLNKISIYTRFCLLFDKSFPQTSVIGKYSRVLKRKLFPQKTMVVNDATDKVNAENYDFNDLSACDILVQVDNFEAGGLENVALDLNESLINKGYRLVLLVLGNQGISVKKANEMGQKVVSCPYSDSILRALLDKLQPKLTIMHYSFNGLSIYQRKNIPVIQIVHNIYMWFTASERNLFEENAKLISRFVAVSEDVKRYTNLKLNVPIHKIDVIQNGIDISLFKEKDNFDVCERLRLKHGILKNEFVFLDIGSINHQKNHLAMVKAFEIFLKENSNAKLLILGPCYEQHLLDEINEYISDKKISDKVIYCGPVKDVNDYLFMCDCFVSATFFEGGPLTLLEALAANKPVVMPLVGSSYDFMNYPGVRLVEPVIDMTKFNQAIWEMKSNPEFEQRLAKALLETWEKPIKPNLSKIELQNLDKSVAYQRYVNLVKTYIDADL